MQTELIEQVVITATAITTTLFDLIGALNAEVGQEEDDRITATVVSLIQAGQLTFVRDRSAGPYGWI